MNQIKSGIRQREGFTLTELVVGSGLFFLFIGLAIGAYHNIIMQARAGLSQVFFISDASLSEQRITRLIEQSKFVQVSGNELSLWFPVPGSATMDRGRISFDGGNSDHSDNALVYEFWTPGPLTTVDSRVLVEHVGPIGSQPIFDRMGRAVVVAYRVGDPPGNPRTFQTGPGIQGSDVSFTVTPRNLQLWFSE